MLESRSSSLLAVSLFIGAIGCRAPQEPAREPRWELRSFEVPSAYREQVLRMLSELFNTEKGRVRLGPDGRLVVFAPPGTASEIQSEVLTPLARTKAPRPETLLLTYWFVTARRAGPGAAPAHAAALEEIAPALAQIERALGPADLALVERMRMRSADGRAAELEGRVFKVKQKASLAGDKVVGDLRIEARLEGGKLTALETRISLDPGQTAVVAEAGWPGPAHGLGAEAARRAQDAGDSLVFVVQATVDDAAGAK